MIVLHFTQIRVGDVLKQDGNFSSYALFSTYAGPYSLALGRLSCARCEGISGRFVAISKVKVISSHMKPLQLVDVNVFVRK